VDVDLSIALVHYPVLNKNGETIASAITNLDLHDISRSARTYGVKTFYVVTPLVDQRELARKIIDHWIDGFGGKYNPDRKAAVELIKITESVEDAVADIRKRRATAPKTVATSAKRSPGSLAYRKLRSMLEDGNPYLLLFGTAWGLSSDLTRETDHFLEPVAGAAAYNHLSVRSASAIILDRLLGRNEQQFWTT
jgi:hypothetical protein